MKITQIRSATNRLIYAGKTFLIDPWLAPRHAFSFVDVPDARERVESRASSMDRLLLSALLIQLWHLQWYTPSAFRARHLDTRDELVARLLG